jgi:hypothetical protein
MGRAANLVAARTGAAERKQDGRAARDITHAVHRQRCMRGGGFLRSRTDPTKGYPAPCRNWRECQPCARLYGLALSHRWSRVTGLKAFVVLTMPADQGDWREKANRNDMMRAWRRLYERLCRRFGSRPKAMHFKEHAGADGRLHLNVLWDWRWIDQGELSTLAGECGFGPICHISSVKRRGRCELSQARAGSSPAITYSHKEGFRVRAHARGQDDAVRRYARKTGSKTAEVGDDWPRHTTRWSASRAAAIEMGKRECNPDWFWSPFAPVDPMAALPDEAYLVFPPEAERPPPARAPLSTPIQIRLA